MKALLIKPRNSTEFKFIADLLNKLGVGASSLSAEELEDIGLSKLMKKVDKTKRASRSEVMRKLAS